MNAHPLQLNLKLGGTEITSLKHWITGQYLSYRSFFKRDMATSSTCTWLVSPTNKQSSLAAVPLCTLWVPQSRVIVRLSSSFLLLNRSTACSSDPNLIYWVLCSWAELSPPLDWASRQQYTASTPLYYFYLVLYKMVWKQLSIPHEAVMDNIEDRSGAHNLSFPWDKCSHRIKLLPRGQSLDWAETWQHRQTLNEYLLWSAMLPPKTAALVRPSDPVQFLPWISTLSPAGNVFQWHLPGPWEAVETKPCTSRIFYKNMLSLTPFADCEEQAPMATTEKM